MAADLLTIADELYGLRPDEFTAARNEAAARAQVDGQPELARQIRALRKPVAAGWVVNLLVRRRRTEVERLFTIADRLREAQRTGDGADLRELNRAAQAVVPAVVRAAADLARSAGTPITDAVARLVHQTLRAAMADPAAAAAVLSGRMVGPLEATGGESVDVSGAVAIPMSVTSLASRGGRRTGGSPPSNGGDEDDRAAADRAAAEQRRNERRRLEEVLSDRESRLEAARSELTVASQALAAARGRTDDLDQQRDDAAGQLREARALVRSLEDRLEGLDTDRAAAERSRRTAEDRAARAERRAEQAAEEVTRVRAEMAEVTDD